LTVRWSPSASRELRSTLLGRGELLLGLQRVTEVGGQPRGRPARRSASSRPARQSCLLPQAGQVAEAVAPVGEHDDQVTQTAPRSWAWPLPGRASHSWRGGRARWSGLAGRPAQPAAPPGVAVDAAEAMGVGGDFESGRVLVACTGRRPCLLGTVVSDSFPGREARSAWSRGVRTAGRLRWIRWLTWLTSWCSGRAGPRAALDPPTGSRLGLV
jgi:hypothetical protein